MKRESSMLWAAAILSFLTGLVFLQDSDYKLTTVRFLLLVAGIVGYNVWLYFRKAAWEHRRLIVQCSIMGLFTLALIQGICFLRVGTDEWNHIIVGGTIALFLLFAGWCLICAAWEKGISEKTIALLIFGGFLIRLFYVVLTQAHLMQNDVESLAEGKYGHLGYVYQIYTTGRLPQVNPVGHYQFYQPPLHYVICALCMRLYSFLGIEFSAMDEILQVLPLFYSTVILVLINMIGKQLKCSLLGRFVAVGIAAFLPYSIFMGGAINNDVITTLFMLLCVYFTLKWYENPNMKGILIMALCIGFAMMGKLSGAMIAPAMGIVMLWKVWKDRKRELMYMKQFVCFGLIAFPLGLGYSVLKWVQYRMPFGYVPSVPIGAEQFIGMYTKGQRFADYAYALENLSLRWDNKEAVDYNIPISLVKYSVFNELDYYHNNSVTYTLGTIVFWVTLVFFILMAAALIAWLFMKEYRTIDKVFLLSGVLVIMYAYVNFCFSYPHVCTMNIRYVMTAVYIGILVLGSVVSGLETRIMAKNRSAIKIFSGLVGGIVALYVICSVLLMINLDMLLF